MQFAGYLGAPAQNCQWEVKSFTERGSLKLDFVHKIGVKSPVEVRRIGTSLTVEAGKYKPQCTVSRTNRSDFQLKLLFFKIRLLAFSK